MLRLLVVAAVLLTVACSSKDESTEAGSKESPDQPAVPAPKPSPDPREAVDENLPPEIVSVSAEQSAVEATGSTVITVKVMDPENDAYHVWWQASCGIVSPSAEDRSRAIYLAPREPGTCTVQVSVQDLELASTTHYDYQLVITPPAELEVVE